MSDARPPEPPSPHTLDGRAPERHLPSKKSPGGGRTPAAPSLSKKIFSLVLVCSFVALFLLLVRRAPAEALEGLKRARAAPVFAGFAVFFLSHAFRGARLNRLLPKDGRISALRAFGLSGASNFILQVVPFRGGDVASLGLVHRELGVSWSHSGGVFVLLKLIDGASAVLVGLAGGTVVLLRHRESGWPWAAGALVVLLAGLALLPRAGGALLEALSARARPDSRLSRVLAEVGAGLAIARQDPRAYAAACALSAGFLVAHVAGLALTMSGLGFDVPLPTIAFATLGAIAAAAFLPSPAGTFGAAESGWTAALALDGVPLAAGVVSGFAVHVVATLAAGLAGLFVLPRPARR